MRLFVLLAVLPACHHLPLEEDGSCTIEVVTAELIDGAAVHDCGTLELDASDAAFTDAHDCVVARTSAGTPFRIQWTRQGIDSRVALGLVSVDGGLYALSYDGDPGGGGGEADPSTWISTCSAIEDLGACADLRGSLCLACTDQEAVEHCDGEP